MSYLYKSRYILFVEVVVLQYVLSIVILNYRLYYFYILRYIFNFIHSTIVTYIINVGVKWSFEKFNKTAVTKSTNRYFSFQ